MPEYEKTVKTLDDDSVRVAVLQYREDAFLVQVHMHADLNAFNPSGARELAKHLIEAAAVAEANIREFQGDDQSAWLHKSIMMHAMSVGLLLAKRGSCAAAWPIADVADVVLSYLAAHGWRLIHD